METFVLRILQDQVAFQCKAIEAAASDLDTAIAGNDVDHAFVALQNILVASANLSKLFWGSRGRKEGERRPLRDSIGVSNDSPLRDPDLRNDFAHFDERVEEWFASSKHKNYMGRNLGPHEAFTGVVATDRFQHFDPASGEATFWDHSVQLKDVLAEVKRIFPAAVRQARKPHWDDPPDSLAERQAPPA